MCAAAASDSVPVFVHAIVALTWLTPVPPHPAPPRPTARRYGFNCGSTYIYMAQGGSEASAAVSRVALNMTLCASVAGMTSLVVSSIQTGVAAWLRVGARVGGWSKEDAKAQLDTGERGCAGYRVRTPQWPGAR